MLIQYIADDGQQDELVIESGDAKCIIAEPGFEFTHERHIHITYEGVIIDIVALASGEVVQTFGQMHNEMLQLEEDDVEAHPSD